MHPRISSLFLTVVFPFFTIAQTKTIQERLGYPKDTKLLIIHADDMGMSQSENAASIAAMEKGVVSCGSIMVPCPWLGDLAAWAKTHPAADLGIHLTLTSEWKNYRWGPVAGKQQAGSLVDGMGFLHAGTDSVYFRSGITDIETELRAQIQRAQQMGIDITHLDSHMGSLFIKPENLQLLIKLGREFKLPVLLNKPAFEMLYHVNVEPMLSDREVLVDRVFMLQPDDYEKGTVNYYTNVFRSLQPGLSCLLLHAAYDNAEMKAITTEHPDYGAAWRQADYDFFTSAACKKLLADQHIKVIGWKEIRDKLFRN